MVKTFLAVNEFPVLKCNDVRDAASLERRRHGSLTVLARFSQTIDPSRWDVCRALRFQKKVSDPATKPVAGRNAGHGRLDVTLVDFRL